GLALVQDRAAGGEIYERRIAACLAAHVRFQRGPAAIHSIMPSVRTRSQPTPVASAARFGSGPVLPARALPALDRGLARARYAELAGRRVARDHRAGADRRVATDLDRRHERAVGTDERAV